MNKSELCVSIANRVGMSQASVEEVLDAFVEIALDRLADGEKVQLYRFGTFDIREREERQVYNPKTETYTRIAQRRSVVFKPGKELKDLRKEL
ncbi:MAG: HU family DNA-binding protein [Clostridia bacterium]|nr:HU family DNA-binding protein [Clostridia bacterium]